MEPPSSKFVAVAAILLRDGKVCLIRSRKNGRVLTPGGRVNPGETLVEALVREIAEETNLRVTSVGRLMGVDDRPEFTLYVFEATAEGELRAGDDAAEAWWGLAEEVRDAEVPRDYPWILDAQRAEAERDELRSLRHEVTQLRAQGMRDAGELADAKAHAQAFYEENLALKASENDRVRALVAEQTQAVVASLRQVTEERDRLQRACIEGLPRETLYCPKCGTQHLEWYRHDAPGIDGRVRPHHTHRCYACGHEWDSKRWSFGSRHKVTHVAVPLDPRDLGLMVRRMRALAALSDASGEVAPMAHIDLLLDACDAAVRQATGRTEGEADAPSASAAPAPTPVDTVSEPVLRTLLAALVGMEHGVTHGHQRCAQWDKENPVDYADQPCRRCHVFAEARVALGQPRWLDLSAMHAVQRAEEARPPVQTPHDAATCGCGFGLYEAR